MKNIWIGFILIFLDFNLNLDNIRIELLPDFIGYIIMISGLAEMGDESLLFMKVKPYATGMAVYSGFLFAMDFMGISVSFGVLTYILAFISTAVSLYISYNIVMGVIYMERQYKTHLNGTSLKSKWTLLATFNILSFVMLLFPFAALISIIVSFVIAIYFLVDFNNTKNLYYNINR